MAFLQILFRIKPVVVFFWLAFLGSLYLISLKSYVLFHSIAELLSIVVAAGIFMLAWNSRRFFDNHYLLFLSIAFVFAAMIDAVHTLAYKGMGVFTFFDPTSNLATQLWISARYIQAVSFLVAPVFLIKKIRPIFTFWIFGLVTLLFFLSIFYWKIFPAAYIEGFGLTQFKITSEYIISLMLAVSALFLFWQRKSFDKTVFKFVFFSILATVGSELFFTTYFGVYDFSNMAGHFLKIIAFYFFYKAIIETGIKNPQDFIFHNLEEGARALKESEKQLDLAIKGSEGGIWRLDFDKDDPSDFNKGYLYISPELKKFIGYEEEEFSNSRTAWAERVLPEDLEKLNEIVRGYISGKIKKYGIEYRIRHKDGSWRWLNSFARAQMDEQGKLVCLVGIAWDVTERNQMIENLALNVKNLEKFQLAIESASDHIIITDGNGVILYANKAVEKITGFSPEEIIGDKPSLWGKQMPPDFYKRLWATIKDEKKPFEGEITNKKKNGESYFAEIKISPVLDENKEIIFFIGVERDITQDKKYEERISRYTERIKYAKALEDAYLSSIGEGIVAVDKEGKILFVNKIVQKFLGYGKSELVGRYYYEAIPIIDEKGNRVPYEKRPSRLVLGGKREKISDRDVLFLRKDNTKISLAVTTTPIIFQGKIYGAISVSRDVTEEKEFDRAKTEFISLAAHQLRTPLTTISLAAEILLRGSGGKIPKEGRGYLKEIFLEVKDMALLIETFLNVSRIEMDRFPVNPEPASLFAVIEKSAASILPQIKNKKLKLEKEYGKDLPILDLDEKVMDIVLSNLLSNAVKYTLKGFIKIKAKKRKNDILIEVSDTGIGIPQSQQDKIFAKMFRADNVKNIKSEGSGLGLFVVKALVEQSGGKIWFESKENRGTSFFVSLPQKGMKKSKISFR